jgi:hypothetical protein
MFDVGCWAFDVRPLKNARGAATPVLHSAKRDGGFASSPFAPLHLILNSSSRLPWAQQQLPPDGCSMIKSTAVAHRFDVRPLKTPVALPPGPP